MYSTPDSRLSHTIAAILAVISLAVGNTGTSGASPLPAAPDKPEISGADCTPSATVLCLRSSRFRVTLAWENALGQSAIGQAQVVADDTGYFSALDPRYPELYVKVLDSCGFNGRFWFLLGTLTDAEFTATVTDTVTNQVKQYVNPLGTRANIADTDAFPCVAASEGPAAPEVSPPPEVTGTCTPSSTTHCLADGRFETQVTWTVSPNSGPGSTIPLTTHAGGFWFFSPDSLDLAVKVVEACDFFQVHFGSTTNVQLNLTITDTETGAVRNYFNPSGTSPAVGDLTAFTNADLPCPVFQDGFEDGTTHAWGLVVGGS